MQFSFLSPFRKGGWGDFETPRAGKSPLRPPLIKGGTGGMEHATENCMTLGNMSVGWSYFRRGTEGKLCLVRVSTAFYAYDPGRGAYIRRGD